jgi:hypothetical protein
LSFRQRYPKGVDRLRYGQAFDVVQEHAKRGNCRLAEMGYTGPGHEGCWHGTQGEWTAHHVGRNGDGSGRPVDADGMIYVCGRAHDLFAGRGGRKTVAAFRAWLVAKTGANSWRTAIKSIAVEIAEGALWTFF